MQDTAGNTRRAYAADWAHFNRWCRMQGHAALPPSPRVIAGYLASLAAPDTGAPLARASIERRLSGLAWNFAQRGAAFDRGDPQVAAALAEIRLCRPPDPMRKAAFHGDDIRAMVTCLPYDLRGLRDRAILLIGYAAGLRRSEIVGLDLGPDTAGAGTLDIDRQGAVVTLTARGGGRRIDVPREAAKATCPVQALERWLDFAQVVSGPVFRRTSRDGKRALASRLSDKHVARLIKKTVLASGIRADLPEAERLRQFSGQSLRARSDG